MSKSEPLKDKNNMLSIQAFQPTRPKFESLKKIWGTYFKTEMSMKKIIVWLLSLLAFEAQWEFLASPWVSGMGTKATFTAKDKTGLRATKTCVGCCI